MDAIASAARPYGAARVEVASAGRSRRVSDGGLAAPLEARVLYARGGQFQVRRPGCPAGSTRQGWSSRLAEEEQAFGAAGALDGQGRGLVSMTTICPVLGSSTVMAWAFRIW